jgi:hypothetical protein
VGATRESTADRTGALRRDDAPRAQRANPPWLSEAWSDVEQATDDEGEDPHAGLYATDGDGSGMCARRYGHVHDEAAGAEVITVADADPHAGALGRAALLQAGLEPEVVVPSNAANGRTIAQLFDQRASLAQSVVRVRGTVIKRTDGILGKTYLHLWDGSAARDTEADDLTVTTTDEFEIGETVEVEGRLLIDQDLGLGYNYSALLDGATRIAVAK